MPKLLKCLSLLALLTACASTPPAPETPEPPRDNSGAVIAPAPGAPAPVQRLECRKHEDCSVQSDCVAGKCGDGKTSCSDRSQCNLTGTCINRGCHY